MDMFRTAPKHLSEQTVMGSLRMFELLIVCLLVVLISGYVLFEEITIQLTRTIKSELVFNDLKVGLGDCADQGNCC